MRTVLQRVSSAQVVVDGEVVGAIGPGLVALVGVTHDDGPAEVATTARKIAGLRLFPPGDEGGERSVLEVGGEVLVVSQFTLYADVRKGRRPSWNAAAPGPVAEPLVHAVAEALRADGVGVATGRFGADMEVTIVGDGPVTIVLDVPAVGSLA
ncbi:D-tyrosyl-tRNA(Tyr) deacylase [Janibacter sp. YIM B02568]|uniref:D-aminoacyl-tRNA deacylase n=1 Tax=Janibacter endophyticus TaxID=2806261 RepID=UPI001950FD8E|nr:D-aminoacyl-tRNA deacylase [Janibacter endophyticus]MBM6545261.1 D-tyrosyl-tRNA(Tyr) deacylase [Janibacter endophyticus]